MATVAKKICDRCNSDEQVGEVVVVREYGTTLPYGIDLCGGCYDAVFAGVEAKGHKVKRANIRPQSRMTETTLTPEQLGD